jgi:hypothetical protein
LHFVDGGGEPPGGRDGSSYRRPGFLCTGIAIDGAAAAALNIVTLGASNKRI